MRALSTIDDVRAREREVHAAGRAIGFVPTMGALHEGHLALIRRARELADEVVVSIYVNPTQFGPAEDLSSYPRPLEADLAACEAEGVAAVFTPSDAMMYPEGFRTFVKVEGLSERIEGAARPGHFRGVTTVVLKLFHIVRPDVAVFGWKDAQQFLILRRMVEDLALPIRMEGVETVREPDGLALSSRNAYLTDEERQQAPTLQHALQAGLARVIAGARDVNPIREAILRMLAEAPLIRLDRLDIVHRDTLEPLERIAYERTLIAIAAHLGRARLIDNVRL
jgi:pantoate--beta-alanine ligase